MFREIKNLKKACQRITKAVKQKEKIIIFADGDLDGVTSALLLEESVKQLGGTMAFVCFSDRNEDGYGLSEKAVQKIKEYAPGLLIVLDCGISSFEGVQLAASNGLEVIIIDHHEVLGKLPSPALVVDPKQPFDKYAFKKLSAVALTYRLSEKILGRKMNGGLRCRLWELAALGTIADMMPEEDYNKIVIDGALQCAEGFRKTEWIAFHVLIEQLGIAQEAPRQIFQKIASILNITPMYNYKAASYLFLQEKEKSKARDWARFLIQQAQERQKRIGEIVFEIEQSIEKEQEHLTFIFKGSTSWEQVLTGPVASKICFKTHKPAFIFKIGPEKCRGSVRMPSGTDAIKALNYCEKFLDVYGGHPVAAGFTAPKDKIEQLEKCLLEYFKNNS